MSSEVIMTDKLKIIEIDLGIDVEKEIQKAAEGVSKDTKEKVDKIIKQKQNEEAPKIAKRKKKEKEQKALILCFEILKDASQKDEFIEGSVLMDRLECSNLSSVVVKIKSFMKKEQPGWELVKEVKKEKLYYAITKPN